MAILAATLTGAALAQAPEAYEATLKGMLAAIQGNSYEGFIAHADARFKVGYTTKMFTEANQKLGPRLDKGYSATYLTQMKQTGFAVYVWKLQFKDGTDDVLLSLYVKDGKVSGLVTQ